MVMVFLLLSAGEVNQDVPLWKKLSYSIGYSGGLCYTGRDLTPYCGYLFCYEVPLYILNSIEAGVMYSLGNKEGIEVGVGYGWARISPSKYVDWRFKIPILFLGYHMWIFTARIKCLFMYVKDRIQLSNELKCAEGKGIGLNAVFICSVNKYIGIFLSLGSGVYNAKRYYSNHTSEFDINVSYNGVGIFVNYPFTSKGGVK